MIRGALHSILHLAYILIVICGVYALYVKAIAPFVPIVQMMLRDGVSLSVAFDSVSVNGIAFNSLYDMIINSSITIIIFFIGFSVLTFVYGLLRKIV